MTEDDVVIALCKWFENKGWFIQKRCLGRQRGNDIEAIKGNKLMVIEAKGAMGKLSHTTRKKFDSGQIKNHCGEALVKIFEQKIFHPLAEFGIAHPHDEYLMKVLSIIRPEIKKLNIKMYWVKNNGDVIVE